MRLQTEFDATKFEPAQGTPQLPVGKHPVVITGSEVKANKENTGGYLQLDLQIIDGPAKGQTGPYRLNLYHSNQQTVEIAHRQLSAICHVIGVYRVQDTQQLHNIPFIAEVALQKDKEAAEKGYTQVVRVYDRNGNEPGKAGEPAQPAQTQQQGWQQQGGQQAGQGQQWGAGTSEAPKQSNPAPAASGGWQSNPPANQQGNGGGSSSTPPWMK